MTHGRKTKAQSSSGCTTIDDKPIPVQNGTWIARAPHVPKPLQTIEPALKNCRRAPSISAFFAENG